MRYISLTQGKQAIVDDEDFERINKFNWHVHKHKNGWYAVRRGKRPNGSKNQPAIYMHREILGIIFSGGLIDHKDGDGLNNQKNNLRNADYAQNRANSQPTYNKSSRYKGLSKDKRNGTWMVKIQKGKPTYLGIFKDEKEAAIAYNKKAIELFGEFAKLNDVTI